MLTRDGEPVDEILELMEALSRKRRYFRLRSGEFLDLNDLANWQETAAPRTGEDGMTVVLAPYSVTTFLIPLENHEEESHEVLSSDIATLVNR